MIHALLQYAQDRGLAGKPGYGKKRIKWILDFDDSGQRFTGLVASDREFSTAPHLEHPEMIALGAQRGQAVQFLVAPLGSFLGWAKDEKDRSKEERRRQTQGWMLREAGESDVVLMTLSRTILDEKTAVAMHAARSAVKPAPKPTDSATIRLGGSFPVESDSWHVWWDRFRSSLKGDEANLMLMACFGTGELVEPESTHPKVKRLTGVGLSQPYAPVITFDKEAYGSYGLDQAQNAAMGSVTAQTYVEAIDTLLDSSIVYSWRRPRKGASFELSRDHARLGGARLLYWYMGPVESRIEVEKYSDLIALLLGSEDKDRPPGDDVDAERVMAESRLRQAIDRIRSGRAARPFEDVRFCVLVLSGAGGRVMVRDYVEGTVLRLAERADEWFADLALDTYWGRGGFPPSLEQVLTAPLPERKSEQDYLKWVTPAGAWRQALWRVALAGGRIPHAAFARALLAHNNTVEKGELTDEKEGTRSQRRSYLRLALVKAYLIRKGIEMKPALDTEHPSSAYHCGRLLAVYDSLQREALGEVGAGVIQRYYGGALTNPSGVFGQLSRMAQTHLSKLDRKLASIYAGRIAEIHNGIRGEGDSHSSFPPALTLDEQALFALGFWHQTAATNREISEAAAAKRARQDASINNQAEKKDE